MYGVDGRKRQRGVAFYPRFATVIAYDGVPSPRLAPNLGSLLPPCRVSVHRVQIYFFQNAEGTGLSPFDSWLLLRGVKTMHLRVDKQQENALRVARFLKAHPCTTHVRIPLHGATHTCLKLY